MPDDRFEIFCPIAKVDDDQRLIYGYASTPAKDLQGDVITLDAVKQALPDYMEWANIREMHQLCAVGVTESAEVDEQGLKIVGHIVADQTWDKIKAGVLKGLSIGGKVVARSGDTIKRLVMEEISVVDRPANPECRISLWKAAQMDQAGEPEELGDEECEACGGSGLDEDGELCAECADKCELPAAVARLKAASAKAGRHQDEFDQLVARYRDQGKSDEADTLSAKEKARRAIAERHHGYKFGDPKRKKYSLNTAQDVRSAWAYINMPRNSAAYGAAELKQVRARIQAAGKHFGVKFAEAKAAAATVFEPEEIGVMGRIIAKLGGLKLRTAPRTHAPHAVGEEHDLNQQPMGHDTTRPDAARDASEQGGATWSPAAAGYADMANPYNDAARPSDPTSQQMDDAECSFCAGAGFDADGASCAECAGLGVRRADGEFVPADEGRPGQCPECAGAGCEFCEGVSRTDKKAAAAAVLRKLQVQDWVGSPLMQLLWAYEVLRAAQMQLRAESASEHGDPADLKLAGDIDRVLETLGAVIAGKAAHENDEAKSRKVTSMDELSKARTHASVRCRHHTDELGKAVHKARLSHSHDAERSTRVHHAVLGHHLREEEKAIKAMGEHLKAHHEAAAGVHRAEGAPVAEFPHEAVGRLLSQMHQHHQAAVARHREMGGTVADTAGHHERAAAHHVALHKVMNEWIGEHGYAPGDTEPPLFEAPEGTHPLAQSGLTEGEVPAYDLKYPYPAPARVMEIPPYSTPPPGGTEVRQAAGGGPISAREAELMRKASYLEGQLAALSRTPAQPRASLFAVGKQLAGGEGPNAGQQRVAELLEGVNETDNPLDATARIVGNMVLKGIGARNTATDPTFRGGAGGRSIGALPTR
jgi:phage head maturation protease